MKRTKNPKKEKSQLDEYNKAKKIIKDSWDKSHGNKAKSEKDSKTRH